MSKENQSENNNSSNHDHSQISQADFNAIIMSVIHDVKNSLVMSLDTLERLEPDMPESKKGDISNIQYELIRTNQSLVRLLSLYKMQNQAFSLSRDQYNVYDLLEELTLSNKFIQSNTSISFSIECDEYLEWYFDMTLISNVINSIINNTFRYAKEKITLSAEVIDGFLHIIIEDDGNGYPEDILKQGKSIKDGIDYKLSSTGLGLFFSEKIAAMHKQGNKIGYTEIKNNSSGGARFCIALP